MSTYNISVLQGNLLEIIQGLNVASNGWLGLFFVYVPAIVSFFIALRSNDDVVESLLVSFVLCFVTTIVVRLMGLVDDYFVLVNILILALIGGLVYYRNKY